MIDLVAAILGMAGALFNMNLSPRLQTYGLTAWLISDILLIIILWNVSLWLVGMYLFYTGTCTVGIYKRWGRK